MHLNIIVIILQSETYWQDQSFLITIVHYYGKSCCLYFHHNIDINTQSIHEIVVDVQYQEIVKAVHFLPTLRRESFAQNINLLTLVHFDELGIEYSWTKYLLILRIFLL